MATYTEPKHIGDLLLVEVKPGWTKDRGTVVAGLNLILGTVLARVAGKYQPLDVSGISSAKKAIGILAHNIDTTNGERPAVIIARGAAVFTSALTCRLARTTAWWANLKKDSDQTGVTAPVWSVNTQNDPASQPKAATDGHQFAKPIINYKYGKRLAYNDNTHHPLDRR
ncbi:head decoration protein [Yersinia pseudotuberculosis]|uniref:head decoration protein n=1 Tax=Yersinia pseudotuberculosis TaxID=633 RepID=UPI003D7C9074